MRTLRTDLRIPLLAAGLLAVPAGVSAQQGAPPGGQPPAANPGAAPAAQLVFEREVFDYPTFERRNPFRPLVSSEQVGPRSEVVTLIGIVYEEEDPASSLGIFSTPAPEGDVPITRRLRAGQTWGDLRVVEVRPREVVVAVDEFGTVEQRIMRLPTRRQGGS